MNKALFFSTITKKKRRLSNLRAMIFTIVSMVLVILKIGGVNFSYWFIFFSLAIALAECFYMQYQLKKKKEQLKKAMEFANHFKDKMNEYKELADDAIATLDYTINEKNK